MLAWTFLLAQALVTFEVEGEGPVRFGVPLDRDALAAGLRVGGKRGAELQWAPLQSEPGVAAKRVWVECAVLGASGRMTLRRGGAGPTDPEDPAAPVVVRTRSVTAAEDVRTTETCWLWRDGTRDVVTRVELLAESALGGPGEAVTTYSAAALGRRLRVTIRPSAWRELGVLPEADGSGREVRRELLELVTRLPRASGPRGAGDYVRGPDGSVVTNLEFDHTLGFLNLALATGDRECLRRAHASARHLVDRDLDARSGLPFRHGRDHRSVPPEPGHVWVSGLLRVGCTFADRDLIEQALVVGRALAARMRARTPREGPFDRLRDEAWPLWELERLLRFCDAAPLRSAADRIAAGMLARWDPALEVLRYGEGERRRGYEDRCWLTAGIALPALAAYAERTGDRRAIEVVRATTTRVLGLVLEGKPGLPVSYRTAGSGTFAEVRVRGAAEGYLLLGGLPDAARRRALRRSGVRAALAAVLDPTALDFATRWAIVARNDWVMR